MFLNGVGGVEDAAVFEVFLVSLLHFDEELFPFLVFTKDIEHRLAFSSVFAGVFRVEIGEVFDDLFAVKQGVEEADEQFLVDFRAKQFLEGKISVEVDVSFLRDGSVHILFCFVDAAKLRKIG